MKLKSKYDVVIIGSGPAGMCAAIYLKRAGINPLILEKESPGGTLNKTHKIENYPGYVDKDGTTLAFRMYSQVENLDIDLKIEEVQNIIKENDKYVVITNDNSYSSDYILIATGKIPRKLDVELADKYEGKGISYCAICDGALYKDKTVAVIGGGNSAMEAALYLSDIAKKVYIVNRSSILRADKKEQDEVVNKDNVEVIFNSKIFKLVEKENELVGIILDTGKRLDVSGIFVCIGQDSNFAYYQNMNLKTDSKGIIVDQNMKTSVKNIYACGDSVSKNLYQVVTATSEGAIAATNIIKRIKK